MKRVAKFGGTKSELGRALLLLLAPVIAIGYCRAAQHDERNGYPFTAALEWRKAAELMSFLPAIAGRCWQQWERLTNLPRRLAAPIPAASLPRLHAPFERSACVASAA